MSTIFQPNAESAILASNSKTLSANNTTANVGLWSWTGSIRVFKLYGIVTTVLGANQTACYWNVYDQSTRTALTAAAGTTISAAGVGGMIAKLGLKATALNYANSSGIVIVEPTTLETLTFEDFSLVANNGATSEIDFTYTTTDAPTSGAIQFFLEWMPLSSGAKVTAL